MRNVTVFCDRLEAAKVNPEKFMTQIKDWEESGYRLNFQIQDDSGVSFLNSIVATQQQHDTVPSNDTFPFAGWVLLGTMSALITISVGWMGLLR